MPTPRDLLKQALDTQESGDFLKALQLENEALIEFQKAGDYLGMAEVTVLHSKTFKHLFQATNDKNFLILARSEARAAVEICEKSGIPNDSAIPYFVLAQMHEALEELPQALDAYKKCLTIQPHAPETSHNRQSVKADIEGHYALCSYKAGQTNAIDIALQALDELEKSKDATTHERNTWLSGAHMRIALMYKDVDVQKSQQHLSQAEDIINTDPELILRKRQLEKLRNEFS